ncbi:MAG: hypothetical protein ACLQUZ_11340 [Rhizomicrobium sp.]
MVLADAQTRPKPGQAAIEIQIDRVAQLFDTLDPFPFQERDLDKKAEDFIVGWARELPKAGPIRIIVHLPLQEADSQHGRALGGAVHSYFHYRADAVTKELKELFRFGRYSLMVGLVTLAICIATGQIAMTSLGNTDFAHFLNEGLVILGWVANWRPIEIFLYEWWPLVRRRRLYRRLAAADVTLSAR